MMTLQPFRSHSSRMRRLQPSASAPNSPERRPRAMSGSADQACPEQTLKPRLQLRIGGWIAKYDRFVTKVRVCK